MTYCAVVESGSWFQEQNGAITGYEEKINCGHKHRTVLAAMRCGEKHYDARYVNGSWQACADWHGYTVHTQHGERVEK